MYNEHIQKATCTSNLFQGFVMGGSKCMMTDICLFWLKGKTLSKHVGSRLILWTNFRESLNLAESDRNLIGRESQRDREWKKKIWMKWTPCWFGDLAWLGIGRDPTCVFGVNVIPDLCQDEYVLLMAHPPVMGEDLFIISWQGNFVPSSVTQGGLYLPDKNANLTDENNLQNTQITPIINIILECK